MRQRQLIKKAQPLIHKKPALFVNTNSKQTITQQKFPCEMCCQLYINAKTKSQSQNRNEKDENKINKNQLEVFEKMLIFYQNNLLHEIQSLQGPLRDLKQSLQSLERLQPQLFRNEEEFKKLEQNVSMSSKTLSIKLSDLTQSLNINNFEDILKSIKDFNDDTLSQNLRYNNQQEQKKFDIIPLTSTDHIKQCQAIAFSQYSRIIVVGYQNQIRIFDKKLNEIQILGEHKKNVSYLQFMTKSDKQFASCSMDGQIMFWDQNYGHGKWVLVQVINDSEHCVTCIKFNTKQNMFFSSGVDCLVKFYSKSSNNLWECFGKIACSSYVVDINLNKPCSKLFVCEYNNIVSVVNQVDSQQKWNLQYQINVGEKILQIQSLSTKNFALLFQKDQKIKIFQKQKEGYIGIQQINLQFEQFEDSRFHMALLKNYSNSDCLLVCGGYQIHILINVNKNFFVAFSYKTPAILNYVRLSEDKNYLSYWEKQSNKIHIMRIEKYLN